MGKLNVVFGAFNGCLLALLTVVELALEVVVLLFSLLSECSFTVGTCLFGISFLAQIVGTVVERSQFAVVIVAQLACTTRYEVVANGCHSVDEMLRSHLLAIEQPVEFALNA